MKTKSGNTWTKVIWLVTISLAAMIGIYSCEQTTGPGVDNTKATQKLLIYSDAGASIPSNGGLANILIKVYTGNDTTNVVSNVRVQFSTNFGSVQIQNELTDAGGYARAIVYSGSKTGSLALTASIENYSNTIFISVSPGAGLVTSSPSEVLADGKSQSMVAATVIDSLGQPVPGALVRFVTTSGTITAQSYSNDLGRAEAVLRSVPSVTDISATITASTVTGKIVEVAEVSNEGEAVSKAADSVAKPAAGQVTLGTTTVVFKGITVTGTVGKTTVFANNADSTLVRVTVKETTSGAVIPDARLSFTATQGTLRAAEAVTDASGSVSVIFFGANVSGVAVVKAALAEDISYSAEISLTKQLFMALMSSPSTLAANGSDISSIKAQITDADGNPVQGEKVYFTTTLGAIQPSSETDLWGFAEVDLRSARLNGRAEVRAKYRAIEKTTYVEFKGAEIKVQATPMILVANGVDRSTVTVTLNDASGVPIVDGAVTLATTKGSLISGDGKSSGTAIVDSTSTTGKITAYLQSDEAGDAVVSITGAGIEESVTIHFTEFTFSLSASEPQALAGGGKVRITAALHDKNGDISPIELKDVNFSSTLGTIVPVERTADGRVVAELTSGNSAGTATVTASMKQPPISSSLSVPFVAADADSVVIRADRMSVQLGGSTVDIRATVYDVTGNPKAGAAVTFSIRKGPGGGEEITPGGVVTNDRGQAVVTFKSGNRGSDLDGVEIQAQVEDKYSNILKLTIAGEPYSVVLGFNASFTTNNDGTYGVGVSAIVSDVNRNKVIDNTIVNFSITGGDVGIIDGQVPTLGGVASTILIYSPSDAGKEVEITGSSGGIVDKVTVKLPGKAGTVGDLRVSPEDATILADGISVSPMVVYLSGMNGEPLSNQSVHCELLPGPLALGKIDPTALTGDPSAQDSSPGKAKVVYTSAASVNDLRVGIRIYSGDKADTVYVNLKGVTISASADPEILPPDGQSKATINVLVKETTTHVPISDAEVRFGASEGYIGGKATTDSNGLARTTFTAPKDPTVTALNPLTANILVSFGAKLDITIPLTIREIRTQGLELFASPTQIPANGTSISTVTALLRDNNSNPVVGEIIRFTTDLGTITAVDSTDANGRAEATLISDRRNGQAHITAIYKNTTRSIPVNFTGVKLNISATPENLFAGGNETTSVTAFVKDAAEVAIVGETVSFEWFLNGERMDGKDVETDVTGRAQVSIAATEAGRCLIRVASSGVIDSTAVTFNQMQLTLEGKALSPANGDTLAVSTGGDSILVSARLFDTVNARFVVNTSVEFYTTLGTIGKNATTDDQGIARTYLQSGNTAGAATVLATTTYQGQRVSKEKQFTFVPTREVGKVTLRVDPNIVSVGGSSSALIAVITDKYGNPIPDAMVNFKILQGPAGGEYIHPITSTTGTSGVAATYFYSGQVPSAFENVHLQAEVGGVASNVATLTIAGAPETIQPSYPTLVDLGKLDNGDGTFTLPISATILDINSNHVVDGTTVYFKINPPEGTVASPVKTTNSVAVSQITYPATSAGKTVELTASAGGKEGKISIPLPGFTVTYLSATASPGAIIADGKSTTVIRATLFDNTGSSGSIPDGTTVSFTTDGGTLNPAVSVTKDGVATTTLTSDKNPRLVTITVISGSARDVTFVKFDEIVSYLTVAAVPKSIPADGVSTTAVTATLFNNIGEYVPDGTSVSFTTDAGTLSSVVATTRDGVASTVLTSTQDPQSVTITAQSGLAQSFSRVTFEDIVSHVVLSAAPATIPADGNSTSTITATILDKSGAAVHDGVMVAFSTDGGTLDKVVVPTVNGVAVTTIQSTKDSRFVRVNAKAGSITESVQIRFQDVVAYINATASPNKLIADGKSTCVISAVIKDNAGAIVPDNTVVSFTTTGGVLGNRVVLTKDGVVSTILTSDTDAKQVSVTVTSGSVSDVARVTFEEPQFFISLSPTKTAIPADGVSICSISATVLDNTGAIVPDGTLVQFSTSLGTLSAKSVATTNGAAAVILTSSTTAGAAAVTARYGAASDVTNIEFEEPVSFLILSASPNSIIADGISTSEITATLRDKTGAVLGDGIPVVFSTDGGVLSAVVANTEAGVAKVSLRSDRDPKTVTVTAKYGSLQSTSKVVFSEITSYLTLATSISSLPADGKSTCDVRAILRDNTGAFVVDGTTVTFSATGGTLSNVVASTVNGVATITFTSGKAPQDVTISAQSGTKQASTTVRLDEVIYYPVITATPSVLPADGKSTAQITISFDDADGNPIPDGTVLTFGTAGLQGVKINPLTVATRNGTAVVTLTSGMIAGEFTLTVSAGKSQGMQSITFEEPVSFISIVSSKDAILADGVSNCTITATVRDNQGVLVADGVPVIFRATGGTLGDVVVSTKNGTASTTLTSGKTAANVTVTAESGGYTDETAITFEAIVYYLTITPSLKNIPADGVSTTNIEASFKDASGTPIPDGSPVTFSTTGGVLSPKVAITVGGSVTTTLTSDKSPKDAVVTVRSGTISDEVNIRFDEIVSYLTLVATPASIVADGKTTSEIKATVKNNAGDSVPDGTVVSFATSLGALDASVVKTQDGIARTTLLSTTSPGEASVTVTAGSKQDNVKVAFEELGSSVNQVAEIELSVSNSIIEADGKTKTFITATLYRDNKGVREIVDVPTTVVFESDFGDISKFVQSDASGKAVAQFTSGVVGTASISAKVGTVTNFTNVIMVPGAPQSIQLTFSPTTVGVKKSGRNESLKISAKVVDSKGNDVADGKMVRFDLIGAFDDSVSITPNDGTNLSRSVPIPTVNGDASVSFHSGTSAGSMRVKATMVDSTGAVVLPIVSSETTQFQVLSGPAFLDTSNLNDPFTKSRMTLAGGPLNIFAGELNSDASKSTITVLVGDRYQNPVPEGTAVYFTTTGGVITSKTGFTNADGLASVTLYAGNPFPKWADTNTIANPNKTLGGPATFAIPGYDFDGNLTMNDGVAVVTAYTEGVDQNGRQVTVWNYVPIVFSKGVSTFTVEPASISLLNGKSTVIEVTLHDENGNPMVGGSTLEFSSPLGKLSTSKITTSAPGVTKYSVTLTNDIDPINGTAGNTVVTVHFKGANGEETRNTVPIFMSISTI